MTKHQQRSPSLILTVDVLIPDRQGRIVLIRRGHEPFLGMWSFPGGIVDPGETVEQAAVREVKEEIKLDVTIDRVIGIYSNPGRDPRGQFVSVALLADPTEEEPQLTAEALEWKRAEPDTDLEMAFDHARILHDLNLARPDAPAVVLG